MELPKNGTSRLAPPWISPASGLTDRSNREMIIIPRRRTTKNIVTNGLVLNLDAGNIASYPGTGTTWTDLSGNGNNGTLVNGPTYTSANGGSLIFDGTNDYVGCGNNASINFGTGSMTASVWFKRTTTAGNARLYAKGTYSDTVSPAAAGFGAIFSTTNLVMGVAPTGPRVFAPQIPVVNNVWINAVMVFERNVSVRSFKDSTPLGATSAVGVSTTISGTTGLFLGALTGPINFYTGEIANFTLYNRALTNAEVLQNFNALRGRYGL